MIVLTGSGALATAFASQYPCRQVSARLLVEEELREIFRSATAIVHNAALVTSSDLPALIAANTLFTKKLIDLAHEVNPRARFVYLSSMSMLKTATGYLPVNQMSPYALSKYFGERYVLEHEHPDKTAVRFSTLFYKDALRDGLSKLAADAVRSGRVDLINKGTATRDFIPLETAAAYLYKIITTGHQQDCWTIASGQATSFAHYAGLAKKHFPGLVIHSVDLATKPVLADFPVTDIKLLGRIPVDMDQQFINYINQLHALDDL